MDRIAGGSRALRLALLLACVLLTLVLPGAVSDAHTLPTTSAAGNTMASDAVGSGGAYLPVMTIADDSLAWSMAGANPQRTSWSPEEVRWGLKPDWYRPIEPYILPNVQIIAAYNTLYVSTAAGLYALDAETGAVRWVYATEMPLGDSPTVAKGIVYVGGYDHKLHAINAKTGAKEWTFTAGAGFSTNPLVVNGLVYAGNRDGTFYAIHSDGPQRGQLAWSYKTGGPILYSAAYQAGVVFFAANDSHAYALNAKNGNLVWKSAKLPGAGFRSWWPVIYGDWVIFAGSNNYRPTSQFGYSALQDLDETGVFPSQATLPRGTLVGPLSSAPGKWAAGTPTVNMSKATVTPQGSTVAATEYLEQKPWRRTMFILRRSDGSEYTTDFDNDGKPEYAPILWFGTKGAGNRYPPVVGGDGVLYQTNTYLSDPNIAGGQISGWMLGTPYISVIASDWGAHDEPHAYAAGGNLIYWNLCCDRQAGAIDISKPNLVFAQRWNAGIRPPTGAADSDRERLYFNYNLDTVVPGYNVMTYVWEPYAAVSGGVYGGKAGSYGWHGDLNPPIPYRGRVYMHRSNAIIAFAPDAKQAKSLPLATTETANDPLPAPSEAELKARLAEEVQKMVDAGHLRPGYLSSGLLDHWSNKNCADWPLDYFHFPGDTIYTLLLALPHLPASMQQPVRAYIESEFNAYPPYEYDHIGWRDGATRDLFDLPPEVDASRNGFPPQVVNNLFDWEMNPNAFYALWRYAETFGGAGQIFAAATGNSTLMDSFNNVPGNNVLAEKPLVHNAYIAGYIGYIKLGQLAGLSNAQLAGEQEELDRLLALRASTFDSEPPDVFFSVLQKRYCRAFNAARNFMFLVPELGQYLHDHAQGKVAQAVNLFSDVTPYWFVAAPNTVYAEGVVNHLYDVPALFQARALILQQPRSALTPYLDVPAFARGDLFYIQNLVFAIEAAPN